VNRNVVIGVGVAVVLGIGIAAAVFLKGTSEPKEPFPVSKPETKMPGPAVNQGPNWKWPDSKWKQWCVEHSRDAAAAKGCEGNAVFRRAAEQGVIGISDEERNRKLDEAWK
jgi:hypothetical protein